MNADLPANEAERLDTLRRYDVLDTPPERVLDDITLLAAQICETPIALITLVDAERQWFKAQVGVSIEETSRDAAFCAHAILAQPEVFVVPDALKDARFADNPLVTSDPNIRFYAGAPLVMRNGHALGTLCVIDRVPRNLTDRQLAALRALRRSVVAELELRRTVAELETARAQLEARVKDQGVALAQRTEHWIEAQRLARVGSYEWDAITDRMEVSPETFRIFGTSPDEHKGTLGEFLDSVHPEDRPAVEEGLAAMLRSGDATKAEYRIVRPDGTVRTLDTRAQTLVDSTGRVVRVFGTAQDITERKRVENELRRARDAALESDRLKSAFLANMSHEVRTPLNIILGYVNLLEDRLQDAEPGDSSLLEDINRASQRLMETMERILDFSQLETGTFRIQPAAIELVPLLRTEVERSAPIARDKGLELSCIVESEVDGATVFADERCLQKSLRNLLDNAIKFTAKGNIWTKAYRDPDGAIGIEIRDTGVGIEKGLLTKVVQPFFQEDFGMTRRFEGSGLGLAVTKKYLEHCGATLAIESEKGQGCTVRILVGPEREAPKRRKDSL